MSSPSLRLAAILAGLLLVSSCSSPLPPGFPWKDASGRDLAFSEVLQRTRPAGNRLGPSMPSRSWALAEALAARPGFSLALRLKAGPLASATSPVEIQVSLSSAKDGSSSFAKAVHRLKGPEDIFILPLDPSKALRSLTVTLGGATSASSSTVEDGAYAVEVRGIEEIPSWAGFQVGPGPLRISAGVSVFRKSGEDHVLIPDSPDPTSLYPGRAQGLLISYGPGGAGRSLQIIPQAGPPFLVKLRPAGLTTVIPPAICGATGGRLELILPMGVEVRAFALGYLPEEEAELADFGRILRAPPGQPGRDYDLYRWDLMPSILIFDFRDYATQDHYLRRLAFFVEKAGYKGRLMTDAELGSLHSWNAHDYRPEDLAAFFELARIKGFPLNKEELALRSLLLERGVLRQQDQAYGPGAGALISISRESAPYLRTMFLTHESTHGIFFADPEYRDYIRGIWAAMGKEEKWYWLLFLGWKEYDTSNSYLLANEYQAYLLQQVLPLVTEYFTKIQPSHILENHKELQPKVDAWMETWKDSFATRAAALDAWVSAKYGFQAGKGASY